jgi:hypothetical protein
MKTLLPAPWLVGLIAGLLLGMPALAAAQDDLGVTLRIVEDDQELDESFVNQLEMPTSLDENAADSDAVDLEPGVEGLANDVREDMLGIESTLSEQSRETREALDLELTGELDPELPGLETPSLEDPALESPDLGLPELNTPELEPLGAEK